MYMYLRALVIIALVGQVFSGKSIKWGNGPCILIDINAYNNLIWIDGNGKQTTVAANFSFDNADVTQGSCDLPNPYVGGLWPDGKRFELVFYNNSGRTNVQMSIYFNPSEVFKHNLTDLVRNIVYFDAGRIGWAYRCSAPTSHVTKVQVGKEAYRYSLGVSSILIQGYGVTGGKFGQVEECPQDMKSSKSSSPSTHSSPATQSTSHSTKPTTHSTKPSTHSTKPSTYSTKPSTQSTKPSTHSTKPSTQSTEPSTHSTKPSTQSTKPSTHSTKPSTHSTKPSTQSTKPSTHSTKPSTHSTKPSTHSTVHSTASTHPSTHSSPSSHSTPPTSPTRRPLPEDPSKAERQFFNTKCVNVNGEFQFNLSYPSTTPGQNLSVIIGVNDINAVTGDCGGSVDALSITFYNNWLLNITMKTDTKTAGSLGSGSKDEFWWSHVYLQYYYNTTSPDKKPWFPNVDPKQVNNTVVISRVLKRKTFSAKLDGSYLCNSKTKLELGDGNSMKTSHLQYNAFHNGPNKTFSSKDVSECSADSTLKGNTYIYVGIGLAVLVTIVMTIYISGRCCYRKNFEEM